jgi:hypothetical protein
MRPRTLLALALAAGFAVLAVAVAYSSALHRADEWAVRHAMPGLSPRGRAPSTIASAVPFRHVTLHGRGLIRTATDVWTLPASPLVSALLFGGGCVLLLRRGARGAAVVWAVVWLAGNTVEALTKHVLERPALDAVDRGERIHVLGFDHSYPSGHALRAVPLASPRSGAASGLRQPSGRRPRSRSCSWPGSTRRPTSSAARSSPGSCSRSCPS